MPRFDYSRWDGTQVGFDFDADDILAEITDDLLYHGDLNQALRRMLQQGFRDRQGERVAGIREMLERLRRRRKDELERYDLGGVYDDIAERLREVLDMERAGIDELAGRGPAVGRPAAPGDHRRGGRRAAHAARPAAARPGRPGAGPAGVRVDVVGGAGALRRAARPAPPGADAELLQPDVRRHVGRVARAAAAYEGHVQRAEPDARDAGAGRGHHRRLRAVHAAVRRLVPRQSRRASTSCSSRWPSRWRPCRTCSTR